MDISNHVAKCVAQLGILDANDISKICKYFLQVLVKGNSNIALDQNLDDGLCAVATILLESAKNRSTGDQIRSILVELAASGQAIDIIVELYNEHFPKIVDHIEKTGIASPAIVGVDWRLDYSIRSKYAGRENAPIFFVSLKVKDRGLLRYINMTASIQELQDLLSKVRDAVKQTDRVLHNTSNTETS